MAIAMRYGSNDYIRSRGASGGGSGGGITMSLIWTNPNPTATFAAQTVSLDLSGYDAIGIIPLFSTSVQYPAFMQIYINTPSTVVLNTYASDSNRQGGRTVTISSNGLQFSAGNYNGSASNGNIIPYKIYGIKGIT